MRILVTAGPTREAIDPVRFLSNRSSGKMGYAVAQEAATRGHAVCLISGPVCLAPPAGVERMAVVTAEEMCRAVLERWEWCDALIMAAAVADWRPRQASRHKIPKTEAVFTLELERTPDILETVRGRKGNRLLIGFAAETDDVRNRARDKLRAKGLDLIVANDVSRHDAGFDVDTNQVTFIEPSGREEAMPLMRKRDVAARLLDWVERHAVVRCGSTA